MVERPCWMGAVSGSFQDGPEAGLHLHEEASQVRVQGQELHVITARAEGVQAAVQDHDLHLQAGLELCLQPGMVGTGG